MRVFTYNSVTGINEYTSEDYGSLTSSPSVVEDYDAIFSQSSAEIPYGDSNDFSSTVLSFDDTLKTFDITGVTTEDYSYVGYDETVLPFGSLTSSDGLSGEAITYNYAKPSIPLPIAGNALSQLVSIWVGNGTLFEIGSGLERTIKPYVASGTLRMDQSVAETALESFTYDYNEDSILEGITDYGGAALADNTSPPQDFGFVYESFGSGIEDLGKILLEIGAVPFGGATFYGAALTQPNYRLYLDGTAIVRVIYANPLVDTGVLGFSEVGLESRTYVYDESSIYPNIDDYGPAGDLSGVITIFDDYQSVSLPHTVEIDAGLLTTPFESSLEILPFGSLGSISGISSNREIQVYGVNPGDHLYPEPPDISSGLFNISGSSIQSYVGSIDNTILFNIFGVALESEIDSYVGSTVNITLFGTSLESLSAQTPENTSLFNVSGISSNREIQVYGINPGDHLYPGPPDISSGLITIYGELTHPDIDFTPSPDGSGSLFALGGAAEAYSAQTPEDTQLIIISEIGLESRTYVYDETSIYSNIDDYGPAGDLSGVITIFDDYQSVSLPHTVEIDAGLLTTPFAPNSAIPPFGSIFISTSFADTREIAVYQDFVPSGLFTISGTPLIHPQVDLTPHYGIDKNVGVGTYAFQLSGAIDQELLTFSWFGSGTLFEIGEKLESRTYVYDETTLIDDGDWGYVNLIGDEESLDNGLISVVAEGNDNWGILGGLGGSLKPFGSINIVNGLSPQETYPYAPLGIGKSWSYTRTTYIGDKPTYTISGIASTREIQVYGNEFVTSGIVTISGTPLVHPFVDLTPHYGIEKNIGIGTTGIQITGSSSALESFTANPPENTQLFEFIGIATAEKRVVFNPPENTQLFNISGIGTQSFVAQTPENTQLFSISGIGTQSFVAQTPENTQLVEISGIASTKGIAVYGYYGDDRDPGTSGTLTVSGTPLVHPEIRLIPHYGIEKNIGIGTTGIQFGVGVGTYPDGDGNPRDAKTYSNRYGFQIGDFNSGSGIGTIRFDQTRDIAKYSPLTPYTGTGLFNIVTGFSPQVLGIGKSWSFSKATYISSGIVTISGIASTREIAVYTNVGFGTITISQQTTPVIEREVDSYVSSGSIYFASSEAVYSETASYSGSGSLLISSTASESYVGQTPDETSLFTIFGSSSENYSAQTPETEVLYTINGSLEESVTNSEIGSGSLTIGGTSNTFFTPSTPGRGLIRFVSHNIDNDYDTCDSEEFTCDNQDSAYVSFVANPVENTALFEIDGSASTSQTDLHEYVGVGLYGITGSFTDIKLSHAELGIGTIFLSSYVEDKEVDVYIGSGTIFGLSGSSESYSAQTPENTILLTISGSASTLVESDYPVVGVGLINFSGSSTTRKIGTFTQDGSGTITLSGELTYPDIIFVPSPDGSGSITILGSSNESISRVYEDTLGTLFEFSSGFESFVRSGYIGVGTIYIQEISGSTINNPFQIPRTYVTII